MGFSWDFPMGKSHEHMVIYMVNPWENHGIFPGFSHGSHENPMINPWNQLNNTRRLEVEIG